MFFRATSLLRRLAPASLFRPPANTVVISPELIINITTATTFVNSLAPFLMRMMDSFGHYLGMNEEDQNRILAHAMMEIWKRKEKLRGRKPGKFIVKTILQHLRQYVKETGQQNKWNGFVALLDKYAGV